jgi:hypothetical protein
VNQQTSSSDHRSLYSTLALCTLTIGVLLLFGRGVGAVDVPPARVATPQSLDALHQLLHDDAVEALKEQRYSAAYGRFAALADEGHAASALMALAMVTHGDSTFGAKWYATPGQLKAWTRLANREVREHGAVVTETPGE